MSDDKKQKSNWFSPLTLNWRLLLIRAVLVSLFIVAAFGITPIKENQKHIEELKKDKSSQIVTSPILGPQYLECDELTFLVFHSLVILKKIIFWFHVAGDSL